MPADEETPLVSWELSAATRELALRPGEAASIKQALAAARGELASRRRFPLPYGAFFVEPATATQWLEENAPRRRPDGPGGSA